LTAARDFDALAMRVSGSWHDLAIGTVHGGAWRVTSRLGGTSGREAYAATGADGEVCIKVWRGPDARERVGRLRDASRLVAHSGFARLRSDQSLDDGAIVVEDWVATPWVNSPAPFERVLELVAQAMDLLRRCHAVGVVHGGITPWRIGRRDGRVCLRGFDRAQVEQARSLHPAAPPWSSPERQQESLLDPRVDHYALAVVAVFLLTGRAPPTDREALRALAREHVPQGAWRSVLDSALAPGPAAGPAVPGTGTVFGAAAPALPALPFSPVPASPAAAADESEPTRPAAAAAPPPAAVGTVLGVAAPIVAERALPFAEPAAERPSSLPTPSAGAVHAQQATGTVFAVRAPAAAVVPFARGADARVAELAQDERALLPLERYAALRAAIWRDPDRIDEILARDGLDRIAWHCFEGRALARARDGASVARLFDALRRRTKKP
jgi:hypothetical protein